MISEIKLTEVQKEKARENTFLLIGLTGKGKSQIVKFLTGNKNIKVSLSTSSTTSKSELFYCSIQSSQYNLNHFCLIDTAGLCDSGGKKFDRKNYDNIKNMLISNNCHIKGIFIIENFQEIKGNNEVRKVYEATADLFPLEKFWDYITIIYTHYFDQGSTDKEYVKAQIENEIIKMLKEVNSDIIQRVKKIESINAENVHKLFINIDDNVLEFRGFDMNNPRRKFAYEMGKLDLEDAKNILYKEIVERIKMEPIYDLVKNLGIQNLIIRKEHDKFNYALYKISVEIREFYFKGKLVLKDFIQNGDKELIDIVNKGKFFIEKIGKGILFGAFIVEAPILIPLYKGIDLIASNGFNYFEFAKDVYKEFFPEEVEDNKFRQKKY